MAVRLEATTKRYIGLSSDEKPTSEVPNGSTFYEEDTGILARYNNGVWRAPEEDNRANDLLEAILEELKAIRELTEASAE